MTGSLQIKGDTYYAVLNFRDKHGKRTQKWINLDIPVKDNKRRAEKLLYELIVSYEGYEGIEPHKVLFSRHMEAWIAHVRPSLAVTTYDQYVIILKRHLRPYFDAKGLTLAALTAGHLEDYYKDKLSEGLSPNSIIKHHAIMRTALQWAVKHRYIRENVADFADKPERVKYRGNAPYSIEEVAQLLQFTQQEPIAVPIFLASFYGLRRSEILGLRWSNIDFRAGSISITTTVVKQKNGNRVETVVRNDTAKSEASMRILPLCQYTFQYFVRLHEHQRQMQATCGSCYHPDYHDFVCVDEMGMLLQPDFVTQKFQQVLGKYGLRPIRFHDLRHSCATIMLYLGYTLKDIQTWLGHSNYYFTADTYVHSSAMVHHQMADTLSGQLSALLPST